MRNWFWRQIGKLIGTQAGARYLIRNGQGRVFGWHWRVVKQTRPHRRHEFIVGVAKSRAIVMFGWMGVEAQDPKYPDQKNAIIFNKLEPGDQASYELGDLFRISQVPRSGCVYLEITGR